MHYILIPYQNSMPMLCQSSLKKMIWQELNSRRTKHFYQYTTATSLSNPQLCYMNSILRVWPQKNHKSCSFISMHGKQYFPPPSCRIPSRSSSPLSYLHHICISFTSIFQRSLKHLPWHVPAVFLLQFHSIVLLSRMCESDNVSHQTECMHKVMHNWTHVSATQYAHLQHKHRQDLVRECSLWRLAFGDVVITCGIHAGQQPCKHLFLLVREHVLWPAAQVVIAFPLEQQERAHRDWPLLDWPGEQDPFCA